MRYSYKDSLTGANLLLMVNEPVFEHAFFGKAINPVLTLVWNRGQDQRLCVDGESFLFPTQTVVPLAMNQTFHIEQPHDLVIWQFDKPFYCIESNDSEVSCIGFLFWGNRDFRAIHTREKDGLEMLLTFFLSELQNPDQIQHEMLRALLKRLLVKLTGLMRQQALYPDLSESDLDLVRQFNVLVERNFCRLHQVQDYARLLHKSPKTLTNLFALHNNQSPLEVIHDRIILEARRRLLYTDGTVGEIAAHLGYEEVAHFSRLFKKVTGLAPADWRKTPRKITAGDIGKPSGEIAIPPFQPQ